jgi:hypothetical protein
MCYGCSFRAFRDGYSIREAYDHLYIIQHCIVQHKTLYDYYREKNHKTPGFLCSDITLETTRQLLSNQDHKNWFQGLVRERQEEFMERFVWLFVFAVTNARNENKTQYCVSDFTPEALQNLQETYKACVLEMLNEMVMWVNQFPLTFSSSDLIVVSKFAIKNINVSFIEDKINTPEELREALVCYFLMDVVKSGCHIDRLLSILTHPFLTTFFNTNTHSEIHSITLEAIYHSHPALFDNITDSYWLCSLSREYPLHLTASPEMTKKIESYRRYIAKCMAEEVIEFTGKDIAQHIVSMYLV